ncbi:multidrug ABC transporter ATP-binding protein [Thermotoga sp. Ku-13t]|uniref:ABC transporter ATP-binding protein n=1 Tax=Thermotoga sp. Ku-13t TaxID=1755813 RepID=UPI0013EC4EF4|nr:ABC transporter ATP-binding protein [Thermotoga sp. Ku-13t]KAF2957751.1 multidrug ABC transporter ATP-binding protein [Thermotoga sp. Ku-13t]
MIEIMKYLKPYLWLVIVTISLVIVDSYVTLYLPDLMSQIVDKGIARGNVDYIWKVGAKMLLVSLVQVVAIVLMSFTSAKSATCASRDIRNDLFKKVQSFSLAEIDRFSPASLITRTTNDITQVQQALVMIQRMVIRAPIIAIGSIFMAISKDAKLTMILLISVPAASLAMYLIFAKVMPLFKSMQKKIDRLNLVLRERITGIRVIRAFNKEEYEKGRFEQANVDLTETALKVNRIGAIVFPIMTIIMNFTIVALIWFGAKQIDMGQLQVGTMMAVMQYVMQVLFSFIMISLIFVFLPRASVSAQRILEVLRTEPSIREPEQVEEPSGDGVVQFENVTFYYPGAKEPALSNVSFTARNGQITAIIGNTGSGKTTILNLIMRFYDVAEGSVKIDGIDVRKIPLEKLRRLIGYAPQKPIIFSGTIAENIRFGRNELTDEDILRAAEIAQVTEFTQKLPEGLNAPVAQGGTNLSGGQKQRISIARAIAEKHRIYLFDDTFSALDFRTDAKIRSRLMRELKDATVIIVAQRVATIMHADQIIVLKDGRVEGIGTHEQLMKTCSVYRDIVLSQISEEEAVVGGEHNGK